MKLLQSERAKAVYIRVIEAEMKDGLYIPLDMYHMGGSDSSGHVSHARNRLIIKKFLFGRLGTF